VITPTKAEKSLIKHKRMLASEGDTIMGRENIFEVYKKVASFEYMKRVLSTLLLVCYLFPCLGFTVSTHYCGKKLTSITILPSGVHNCPCGKKSMKKACCKDRIAINENIEGTVSAK
jgi:hypothetical protein